MAPSQTRTHGLTRVIRPVRIAARDHTEALRGSFLKASLLRIAVKFRATSV
jgi:hypothetical protein